MCLVHLAGFLSKINQLSLSLINGKTQASKKNSELWELCIYSKHNTPQVHVKTLSGKTGHNTSVLGTTLRDSRMRNTTLGNLA